MNNKKDDQKKGNEHDEVLLDDFDLVDLVISSEAEDLLSTIATIGENIQKVDIPLNFKGAFVMPENKDVLKNILPYVKGINKRIIDKEIMGVTEDLRKLGKEMRLVSELMSEPIKMIGELRVDLSDNITKLNIIQLRDIPNANIEYLDIESMFPNIEPQLPKMTNSLGVKEINIYVVLSEDHDDDDKKINK